MKKLLLTISFLTTGALGYAGGSAIAQPTAELEHGGGLNACGCHFNRKTGACHCHQDRGCGCACQPDRCEK